MVSTTDNFNRADSTSGIGSTETGGLTWKIFTGTWGITANQAYTPTGRANSVVGVDLGTTDMTVQATIPIRSGGAPVLAARIADAVNWIGYDARSARIIRCRNGSYTTNATTLGLIYLGGNTAADLASTASDALTLACAGTTVTFAKNGTAICSVNDDTTGTYAGFRTDNPTPRFDNFTASTTGAPAGPTLTNTAAPTITGPTTLGQTLAVTTGTWSATPDAYAYQWLRTGTEIPGATTDTHGLDQADVGGTISCRVTASKADYANGTFTTAPTATIAGAAGGGGTIPPTDSNIVYSPYTWDVTSARAQTVNSGAYLRTTIAGTATSIIAKFDLTGFSGSVNLWVRVDDAAPYLAVHAAAVTIVLPVNNWAKHTVEIVVSRVTGGNRWSDPPTARVRFTGFTVAPDKATTATTRRRPYNVLCYGDSILEGYGTLASGVTDARFGWGQVMRDLLGAEVGTVGFNASGLTTGGESSTPALPSSYRSLWAGTARSFQPEPTVILINLGTNDGGTNVTSAATTVLDGLLSATTNSKIVVVQQYNGTAHKAHWQAAIAACSTPARVTYLDTTGWLSAADTSDGTHPYGYIHLSDLSPRVAAAVVPLISGTTAVAPKRFINVGGVAKPTG